MPTKTLSSDTGYYTNALPRLAGLTITGPDALVFLQGQFTCDLSLLTPLQAALGAYCDHKGRVLANFWIWPITNGYALLLPQSMQNIVHEQLKKYALRSKLTIQTDSNYAALLYCHPETHRTPSSYPDIVHTELALADSNHKLTWLIATPERLAAAASELSGIDTLSSEQLLILAGFCFVEPTTSTLFTPQMLSLENLGAVSFRKGCYVGQEVVARTQHLGKLKRHLYRCHLTNTPQPEIGAALHTENNTVAGVVTAWTKIEHGYLILAVIQDHALDENILFAQQVVTAIQPAVAIKQL